MWTGVTNLPEIRSPRTQVKLRQELVIPRVGTQLAHRTRGVILVPEGNAV